MLVLTDREQGHLNIEQTFAIGTKEVSHTNTGGVKNICNSSKRT